MKFDAKTWIMSGAALVLGLALGGALSGSGIEEEFVAALDQGREEVSGLSARFDELRTGVSGLGSDVSGSVEGLKQELASMRERVSMLEQAVASAGNSAHEAGAAVAALGSELKARAEETHAAVTRIGDKVDGMVKEMTERHRMMAERHAAMQTGGSGDAESAGKPAAPATPEASAEAEPDGTAVGETVMLADGALRVFVASVDEASGKVRVAINGFEQTVIGLYSETASVVADGRVCRVMLDAIDRGHARISAECEG